MLDNGTSFEELVQHAGKWESQLNQVKAKKSNMGTAVLEEVRYALHSTISAEVGRTVAAVMSEFKESLQPILTPNVSVPTAAAGNGSAYQTRVPLTERVCYYCSKKGHIVRFCRAKIVDEERRRVAAESGNKTMTPKQPTAAQPGAQSSTTGGTTKGK